MATITANKAEIALASGVTVAAGTTEAAPVATTSTYGTGGLGSASAVGARLAVRITNPATPAVTAGCSFRVQVSADGATWYSLPAQQAGVDAGAVYDFPEIDVSAYRRVRVIFFGNTGADVTATAIVFETTSYTSA